MSEAEELLAHAAAQGTRAARALWRRYGPTAPESPCLGSVERRIELFVTALYGACPKLVAASPPAPPTLWQRLLRNAPAAPGTRLALACTDGTQIALPQRLPSARGLAEELALMQLLALELAARVQRGTLAWLPEPPLVRDLYLLSEASAIDAQLARELPGLAQRLATERARALASRAPMPRLSPREAGVEALLRQTLSRPASELEASCAESPRASLAWALLQARRLEQVRGVYRGLPEVALWGRLERVPIGAAAHAVDPQPSAARLPQPRRVSELARTPRLRPSEAPDARPGAFIVKPNAAEQSVEDPHGLSRPADRETTPDLQELGAALAELPEAQLVRSDEPAVEILLATGLPPSAANARAAAQPLGHSYPEWDHRLGRYAPQAAVVHETAAVLGDAREARTALARHAALVHEIHRRFQRLRLRPKRLTRQLDGDELDLAAYVEGFADRRAGALFDDRQYEASRRLRRELTACVLLDASASTDAWVNGRQRVIDVEREALLVVAEALERLADRYALLAFSGEGKEGVEIKQLKAFDERSREQVHRRIAGLEPDRYTRAGAALRHATRLLSEQPTQHRLLVLLSDGKPNDVDVYAGHYGVEDCRKAVLEARRLGVQVFCVAVDRQAPRYAPRIFGANGFAVLAQPQRLPAALVRLLRQLTLP